MLKRFAEMIIERRILVLSLIALATIFFGYYAVNIDIKTDYDDQLPRGHEFMEVHKKYKDQLGGSNMVMVMLKVKEGDIFTTGTLKKIQYIQETLDSLSGVNHYQVLSLASPKIKQVSITSGGGLRFAAIMPGVPETQEDIEALKRSVHTNDNVYGPLISYDDKCALVTANFIEGKFDYTTVFTKVNQLLEEMKDTNTEMYAGGEPMLTGWILHYRWESVEILLLTVLVMCLLLFSYFRNLQGTLIPMIGAGLSAIWGLGFCGLVGYSLDPLVLVIPLLITARAISHSVQMNERFLELYHEYRDKRTAAIITTESILPPGLLGLVCDIGGTMVVAVAPIPLLQKLAWFSTFWLISIIINTQILNPILFYYFPTPRNVERIVNPELYGPFLRKMLDSFTKVGLGKPAHVVVYSSFILFIVTGIITFKLEIGDIHPGSPILHRDSEYNIAIKNINENFPGTDQLFFIVEGDEPGLIRQPAIQQRIQEAQIFLEQSPYVGLTQSFADYSPNVNKFLHAGDPKWEVIPEDQLMMGSVMNIVVSSAATGDFDRIMSRDHKDANIVVWCKDHKGDTIREVLKRCREWVEVSKNDENIKFRLASGYLGILGAVNEVVAKAQAQNLVLILLIIVIATAITYRSMIAALLLLFLLQEANFVTMVVMVWQGISLNVNTIPVASIGIGIGIDYAMYVLTRIKEEYQIHGDLNKAIPITLRTTGKAVFFTATTMTGGVLLWYFLSSLRFQAEMGLLLALLMLINMFLALGVLPALVYVFRPKFIETKSILIRERT